MNDQIEKTMPSLRALAAKVARVHGAHNPRLEELSAIVAELADAVEADEVDDELLVRMRAASDGYAVPEWACNSYRTLFAELARLEGDVRRWRG